MAVMEIIYAGNTAMKNNKNVIMPMVIVLAGVFLIILYINRPGGEQTGQQTISKENKPPETTVDVKRKPEEDAKPADVVEKEIIVIPDIDYKDLQKDKTLKELMSTRKENLGLKKSLDMIVHSDESFIVGDNKISMRDILEQAFIKEGSVFEEKIEDSGAVIPQKIKKYGIYVVQPGDNIWNIHFKILKEFYETKGINVSSEADEPVDRGLSSGVGKILKFSETMVIIYNLVKKKVVSDINLIDPLSKIVVYNMDEVFSLLYKVNYENIDRLQFDGKTIWIPAKKQ